MKIILLGQRGSGKTTLSKLLKGSLGIPILKRYTDKSKKEHDEADEYEFIDCNTFDDLVKQGKIYYGNYKSSRFGINKSLEGSWISCLSFGEMVSLISDIENEVFIVIYVHLEDNEIKKRLAGRNLSISNINKIMYEDNSIIEHIKSIVNIDDSKTLKIKFSQNYFIFIPYYSMGNDGNIVEIIKSCITAETLPTYDLTFLNIYLNELQNIFREDNFRFS